MNESKLLKILPDYICTPDGMEIDAQGNPVERTEPVPMPMKKGASGNSEPCDSVTLTIGEKGALTVCGELAADNGGKILNNGSFRCELNGSVHMAAGRTQSPFSPYSA